MGNSYRVDINLEHTVTLDDSSDLYGEIIQHYESKIICMRGGVESVAGTFDFYVANVSLAINSGIDIVDVADSLDEDLFQYCQALFEPGTASEIREEVIEQFEYPMGSRMLMLHLAKVLPEHRGRHLALVAAHKIIEQYGDGLVVAKAQPLQHHDGFNQQPEMAYETLEPGRAKALKRLTRHWRRLGFEPIGDTGYLGLSTANKLPVPKLRTTNTSKKAPASKARRIRPPSTI